MRLIDADELKKQIKYTGKNDIYIFMNIAIESAIDKAPTIETTKTILVDDVDWLGGMLKNYRKMKGLTQRDLARRMGVSPAAICQYEKGHRNLTRIPTLKRLADALGISISDFFIGYEEFEEENTENGRVEDDNNNDNKELPERNR